MKVRVIRLYEPEFFGTVLSHNVTIVEGGPSGGLMMVDTGLPGYLELIEKELKNAGYSIEDISDVVITHYHIDHSGNAEEIRKIAKAKVYAHESDLPFLSKSEQIFNLKYEDVKDELKVSKEDFDKTVKRINSMKFTPVNVDVKLKGNEEIGEFKTIHVPGHTPGHIALYNGEVLIVGDAVRNIGGKVLPPLKFFSWNYEEAKKSFELLLSMKFKYMIPFHGDVINS
ncbi:MBL fold metallo-hydrolase [Acidianus sp. HS-5]|uniref:MBL fold metallo-hydrolase n=1 Tax=Acidianus sp. HS-5 TaxID=2886040 RepID=UPI001F1955BF|nr:MBL fold metallo-hydrolase [Acidianus sp. HS-5]BDC17301.1 hydrolase [Acidianus sp. HS-5]